MNYKELESIVNKALSKMGAGDPSATGASGNLLANGGGCDPSATGASGNLLANGGGYVKDGKETFIPATGRMVYISLDRIQQEE